MLKFVFASEDDSYLLDSLLSVSLDDYLYFQGRKEGFDLIFFISCDNEGGDVRYSLLPADQAAGEVTVGRDFWGRKQRLGSGNEGLGQEELLGKLSMLAQNRKRGKSRIGMVFELRAFCCFFRQESNLQQLLIWLDKPEGPEFVLKVPVIAEHCVDAFLAESSVFRHRIQDAQAGRRLRSISPVLYELLQQGGCLFEKMERQMGDQCVFLNRFTQKNLERVVRRSLWIDHPERRESPQMQRDVCDFLYAYYHSAGMPRAANNLLRSNESHHFRQLQKDLNNEEIWNQITQLCRRWRGEEQHASLRHILRDNSGIVCDQTEGPCVVFRENPLLLAVQSISRKLNIGEAGADSCRGRLLNCLEQLQKPGTFLQTPEVMDWQRQCLEAVEKLPDPARPECTQILEMTAEALNFGLEHRFAFRTREDQEKWQAYLRMIKLSDRSFVLWQNLHRQEAERDRCQQKLESCQTSIADFEKKHMKKYLRWLDDEAGIRVLTPQEQKLHSAYTDLRACYGELDKSWKEKNTQLTNSQTGYKQCQQLLDRIRNKIRYAYVPELDLDEELKKLESSLY